jgi:hypothetical protein
MTIARIVLSKRDPNENPIFTYRCEAKTGYTATSWAEANVP